MKWLRVLALWSSGYSLRLYNWSILRQRPDCRLLSRVLDVPMHNKRYCTVVFWPDKAASPQPPQETPCTNSVLRLTCT